MPVFAIPSEQLIQDIKNHKKQAVLLITCFLKKCSTLNYPFFFALTKSILADISNSDNPIIMSLSEYINSPMGSRNLYVADDSSFFCFSNDKPLLVNGQKSSDAFSKLFMTLLSKNISIPIVVSKNDQLLSKQSCNYKQCSNSPCSIAINIHYPQFTEETFNQLVEKSRLFNLDSRVFNSGLFKKSNFEITISGFLDMLGVNLNERKNYKYTAEFKKDFMNRIDHILFPILLSTARVVGFPPAQSDCYIPGSIDYHDHGRNSYIKVKGVDYHLIRADILSSFSNSGITNSGSARALIAEYNNTFFFISFTENHDFDDLIVRERLEHLSDTINDKKKS